MALLVAVVILVVVGVAHCLTAAVAAVAAAAAAWNGSLGAEDGRIKPKDEDDDTLLLLHVLVPLLVTAPKRAPLVDGGRRPIIIVNVCKLGVRPPPAAAAAATTRVAHCKSRRQ